MDLRSSIDQVAWPAVTTGFAAALLALQRQFDASQWWSPRELRRHQFRQLHLLVAHARHHVPFHARRLREAAIDPDDELTEEAWQRLPILTRREVQHEGEALQAPPPPSHGKAMEIATGGSTGVPVRIMKTGLDEVLWHASVIREELWHREDPLGTIARIRGFAANLTPEQVADVLSTEGLTLPDWGPPASLLWRTGPIVLMHYLQPIPDQVAFLLRLRPAYLFTTPNNLRLLLWHFRDTGLSLPSLRAVWTVGEVVDAPLRSECRAVFGCRIVHNYAAQETGYIALQCPEHEIFHAQAETMLVEIVDDAGRQCGPGETGRVIVTPLHNFATPLLRYEIGDEAEVGAPCACGRGLPVLNNIIGRTQDYVTLPSGVLRRLDMGSYVIADTRAIREYQLVQRSLDRLELLLVVARPLTPEEEASVRAVLSRDLGSELRLDITYCESIARTAAGKLRPFISDMSV